CGQMEKADKIIVQITDPSRVASSRYITACFFHRAKRQKECLEQAAKIAEIIKAQPAGLDTIRAKQHLLYISCLTQNKQDYETYFKDIKDEIGKDKKPGSRAYHFIEMAQQLVLLGDMKGYDQSCAEALQALREMPVNEPNRNTWYGSLGRVIHERKDWRGTGLLIAEIKQRLELEKAAGKKDEFLVGLLAKTYRVIGQSEEADRVLQSNGMDHRSGHWAEEMLEEIRTRASNGEMRIAENLIQTQLMTPGQRAAGYLILAEQGLKHGK
ncbi:MAG: hypothetical protein SFY92_06485, partial [Verrucomicrobiae bacterium]|nr:hypothetical protein [Verrucomicrobiae bacterium]